MRPSHFVPARDSRHRHACLALYRALVREGRRIPLPEDAELSQGPSRRTTNPVQRLITRQYRRNRADTSPRLVFAALEAGYKFLSLFKAAQVPSSAAHAEVLSHLRARQRERARSLAHNQIPPSTSRRKSPPPTTTSRSRDSPVATNPKPPPLLTRHTAPDGTTSYTPNLHPTPFERLRDGRRHVPRLFVTADGIPYLRLRKPQPVILDQVIRGKGDRLRAQVQTSKSLQEDALPTAKEEDKWECLVRDLYRKEKAAIGKDGHAGRASFPEEVSPADEKGYAAFVQEGIQYALQTMHESRRDGIARALALQKIVDEEKRLRKAETERRQGLNSTTKRRTTKWRYNRAEIGGGVDSQVTAKLSDRQAAQQT